MSEVPAMDDDVREPQELAAQDFMAHKGYGCLEPIDVEETEPGRQWIFYYVLPSGDELDLQVTWVEREQDWDTFVDDYRRRPRG